MASTFGQNLPESAAGFSNRFQNTAKLYFHALESLSHEETKLQQARNAPWNNANNNPALNNDGFILEENGVNGVLGHGIADEFMDVGGSNGDSFASELASVQVVTQQVHISERNLQEAMGFPCVEVTQFNLTNQRQSAAGQKTYVDAVEKDRFRIDKIFDVIDVELYNVESCLQPWLGYNSVTVQNSIANIRGSIVSTRAEIASNRFLVVHQPMPVLISTVIKQSHGLYPGDLNLHVLGGRHEMLWDSGRGEQRPLYHVLQNVYLTAELAPLEEVQAFQSNSGHKIQPDYHFALANNRTRFQTTQQQDDNCCTALFEGLRTVKKTPGEKHPGRTEELRYCICIFINWPIGIESSSGAVLPSVVLTLPVAVVTKGIDKIDALMFWERAFGTRQLNPQQWASELIARKFIALVERHKQTERNPKEDGVSSFKMNIAAQRELTDLLTNANGLLDLELFSAEMEHQGNSLGVKLMEWFYFAARKTKEIMWKQLNQQLLQVFAKKSDTDHEMLVNAEVGDMLLRWSKTEYQYFSITCVVGDPRVGKRLHTIWWKPTESETLGKFCLSLMYRQDEDGNVFREMQNVFGLKAQPKHLLWECEGLNPAEQPIKGPLGVRYT